MNLLKKTISIFIFILFFATCVNTTEVVAKDLGANAGPSATIQTPIQTPNEKQNESQTESPPEKQTGKQAEKPLEKLAVINLMRSSSFGIADGIGQVREDAEFVKLSWIFEKPISLSRVEVESCGAVFDDGVEMVIGDSGRLWEGQSRRVYLEGGKSLIDADLKPALEATSLLINFGHSRPICLKAIRFYVGKEQVQLVGHSTINSTNNSAIISSKRKSKAPTLPMAKSRDRVVVNWRTASFLNLFDSRPETMWSFAPEGTALNFEFKKSTELTGLRIWNGDQRTMGDFKKTPRIKTILISGDNGFRETFSVSDVTSSQDIQFKKSFNGKKISIAVESVHGEKSGTFPAMAELRFLARKAVFLPVFESNEASQSSQRDAENLNVRLFGKFKLDGILDHELVSREESDNWMFRFRADGTFFVRGYVDESRSGRVFQAYGTYDVEPDGNGRLVLKLVGFKFAGNTMFDFEPCFLACMAESADKQTREVEFEERIEIEKPKGGEYMIRNRNQRAERALFFSDLRVRLSSLQE